MKTVSTTLLNRRSVPGLSRRAAAGLGCAGLLALLTGCFAQQADLARVSKDLDKKIAVLNQQDKEFSAAIKEEKELIGQQKSDFERHINEIRARLRQDIRDLKEDELSKAQGKLEETDQRVKVLGEKLDDWAAKLDAATAKREALGEKRFVAIEKSVAEQGAARKEEAGKLAARMDATNATLAAMAKTVDGRLEEHDKAISTAEAHNKAVKDQLTQLSRALVDFKQALAGMGDKLGDKLAQQEQRTNELSAKHEADARATSARLTDLHKKLEIDSKATADHLDKVTKSVNSVVKALEAVSTKLVAQQEAQERRLGDTATSLKAVTTQLNVLTQHVTKLQGRTVKGKPEGKLLRPAEGTPESRHEPPAHPAVSESAAAPVEPAAVVVPREAAPESPAESGATPPAGDATREAAPAETSAVPAEDERTVTPKAAYDRSMQKFKQRDLNGALDGFSDFLSRYPNSELASNAQFWIGECHYGKGEYARAIEAYDRVKKIYPSSEKLPAALLKKGLTYLALRDRRKASSVLTQVVEAFPASPEAGKARDKLAQLKQGQ